MVKRLLALLFFFFLVQWSNAQSITYQASNKSFDHILNQIERQFEFHFGYSTSELKGLKTSLNIENATIEELLTILLSETDLVYELLGNKFIAIHKPQSVFFRANIRDEENNTPLSFASVRLKGTNLGAIADDQGEVYLVIRDVKNPVLEVSFLGYEPFEITIDPTSTPISYDIKLKPIATALGSVEVKEYLNSGIVSNDMAGSFKISPQEMEILPGLVERDPLLSVQILSGINSNGESATRLNVRGSSPENTFTYWNNIPIYQSGHYFGTITNFIPASVKEIDVYKNFVPIEYSGPSAGMINLKSDFSLEGVPKFGASINMTHADIYANLPFKKNRGAIILSARRSYNDLIVTPTYDAYSEKLFDGNVIDDGNGGTTTSETLNTDLKFSDINFKWAFQSSEKAHWSLSAFHSKNKLAANTISDLTKSSLSQNHDASSYGFNAQLNYQINSKWVSDLSLIYTDYDMSYSFLNQRTDDNDDSDDDIQNRNNQVKNMQMRWSNNLIINSTQMLKFGIQSDFLDVKNRFNATSFLEEDFEDLNESKGVGTSLFGEYILDISNSWEVMLGVKANTFSTTESFKVNPQIRTNYKVSNPFTLKATYGHYTQYVRAIEETEYTLSNSIEQHWVLADDEETIPLTTNKQLSFGFVYDKNGWMIDVDFFSKNIDGLLARNFGFNVANQSGFAEGKEQLKGIDLTVRKRWRNIRSWLSYGFQDSEAEFKTIQEAAFPSTLNIRHQFQLATTFKLKAFEFSLGYSFKTGLPYSEVEGITLVQSTNDDDDDDDVTTQEYYNIDYKSPNGNRLPYYHRLDFSAWYKFKSKAKFNGEIGLSLINIFDRKNTYNRSYSIELNELNEPVAIQRDRYLLGFTPNLSIRINF
jgi:TonB dependent receptor-like, beta-barrel/CarboxypepD_reg-like domain/FecR, C-terminal